MSRYSNDTIEKLRLYQHMVEMGLTDIESEIRRGIDLERNTADRKRFLNDLKEIEEEIERRLS